jgi:hypothetical protein
MIDLKGTVREKTDLMVHLEPGEENPGIKPD